MADAATTPSTPAQGDQPAPAADDQNAAQPAAAEATAETPKEETPEQIEERRKQREREHNQRRLTRRTTEAAEAKAEAKLLREENERLRKESAARTQGSDEPQRTGINPKTGAEYTYEEYLEARAEWRADKRVDQRLESERKAQQGRTERARQAQGQAQVAKQWTEREETFQKATKDYAEVVGSYADGELGDLHQATRTAISESERGPELLYHLAKNPDVAARISELSPLRQVAELGKLEDKLTAPAKRTTNAPDPIRPVGSRASGQKDLEKMSQAEYEAERKARGARYG